MKVVTSRLCPTWHSPPFLLPSGFPTEVRNSQTAICHFNKGVCTTWFHQGRTKLFSHFGRTKTNEWLVKALRPKQKAGRGLWALTPIQEDDFPILNFSSNPFCVADFSPNKPWDWCFLALCPVRDGTNPCLVGEIFLDPYVPSMHRFSEKRAQMSGRRWARPIRIADPRAMFGLPTRDRPQAGSPKYQPDWQRWASLCI